MIQFRLGDYVLARKKFCQKMAVPNNKAQAGGLAHDMRGLQPLLHGRLLEPLGASIQFISNLFLIHACSIAISS
jgi:hypothetical protein